MELKVGDTAVLLRAHWGVPSGLEGEKVTIAERLDDCVAFQPIGAKHKWTSPNQTGWHTPEDYLEKVKSKARGARKRRRRKENL